MPGSETLVKKLFLKDSFFYGMWLAQVPPQQMYMQKVYTNEDKINFLQQ